MDLSSTQEYSLSKLFSTPNRKIIIPDFQRDYCWGDKTHGEKHDTDIVSSFVDTLIEEFKGNKSTDVLLGKIDVYEHPKNYIYLTDGQQRLTSLYLLLGMLYRNEKNVEQKEKIKRCLISDFEKNHDDKEPYLQYAVRESTVFFLRDLVNDFFIENKVLLEEEYKIAKVTKQIKDDESLISFTIKNQPWYFSEYDLDPSVISMISALNIIEKKRNEINTEGFSEFIINNIKIQYYNVQNKKHGEERFVIINTTGKSLTVSENIKPILLANLENFELSEQWEQRETYFWKNRNKEKENIADYGVNDFLTWCFQIRDKQDEIDIIKKAKQLLKEEINKRFLEEINKVFNSLKQLIDYCRGDKFQIQFKFINDNKTVNSIIDFRNLTKEKQQNILLPLLAYISKFSDNKDNIYLLLRRLRQNYFDLKWRDRKSNYVDWRYILQIIERSNSLEQILQYKTNDNTISRIQNVELNNWFSEERKLKIELAEHKNKIEEWEDHWDFMGDLSFLFQANTIENDSSEIPNLNTVISHEITRLEKIYQNYQSTIDLIRSQEEAEKNTDLANIFRLFRLYIGCNKVGHIYRASWDFEGVLFSTLNREHLSKIEFMQLLNAPDLLSFSTSFIKDKIKSEDVFNLEDFSTEKYIKAWLTLKVFYANEKNVLLAFYDGNETGVAAYKDKDKNKLVDDLEFSLANSICGFGVRSGFGAGNHVHYTNSNIWCTAHIIDTPFSDIAFEKENRTKEQIEKNKGIIDYIMNLLIHN